MTDYFTEAGSETAVIARLANCSNPRLVAVLESAIRHLHGFVKEVEPTTEEWMQAIQFLTAIGQKCDGKRQEWILASDVLGVSMLVDAINHRRPDGATENTVLGPFHLSQTPKRALGDTICLDGKGKPCRISGRVTSDGEAPIAGATIDVWQTNDDGYYDVQQPGEQPDFNMRGVFESNTDGQFWFTTVKPLPYSIPSDGPVGQLLRASGRHAMRPAHIHLIVSAPGYQTLVTHIFVRGDPYLESDAVFGVKESLIADFESDGDGWGAEISIVLAEAQDP